MTEETQALVAEWGEAVYLAREDYTVDPHQHIERLVQRGDYLADALASLSRDLAAARQERDAALAEIAEARRVLWLAHRHEGIYGDDGEMQCGECAGNPPGERGMDYRRDPLPLSAISAARSLQRQTDAAVRAARAETWAEAALLAGQSATAIRHMRQAFVASPVMGELAVVRAEALEQFAKGLHERATAAREGQ